MKDANDILRTERVVRWVEHSMGVHKREKSERPAADREKEMIEGVN